MAKNGQRAQKAGAKAAKRRQVVAEKKRLGEVSTGLAGRIALAATSPVERCLRTRALFELGIGYVIVTKTLPSHMLSCAFFLVDTYCLGVKDIHHLELSALDFEERLESLREASDFIDMDPARAGKLVRDSVAFAAKGGLKPAKDYAVIGKIFGDIGIETCTEEFVFGKDGKPFYVAGPNDTPAKIRDIVTKLSAHYGPDEWDFTLPLPDDDDDELLFDEDDDEFALDGGPVIEHEPNPR